MKKSLINIVMLVVLDILFIYIFYFATTEDLPGLAELRRQETWKIEAGQALMVFVISLLLVREVVRYVRGVGRGS